MVQMNKDERVWVCYEMARVLTGDAVQRLWPNRWPVRRVPAILTILENYRKYRQYAISLNKDEVNSGRYHKFLVTLLSKEKLKIKALVSVDHFILSSPTHSSVNFCSILKN